MAVNFEAGAFLGLKGIDMKRIMVDMSCTLLHHGHIRILKKASELGTVVVALTTDEEILLTKGYLPELSFSERKEILLAIKYVDEVIPTKWLVEDDFIIENKIDILVHGSDNSNKVSACELIIFDRTEGISTQDLRVRGAEIYKKLNSDIKIAG